MCQRFLSKRRALAHEKLADSSLATYTEYDMKKRVRLVFDRLLPSVMGTLVLDAGSGRGWFTLEAVRRGAQVVAVDVGPRLVRLAASLCECTGVVADAGTLPFRPNIFGAVICSEVIEHLDNPVEAIAEISRVMKPGGSLALTTPNRLWYLMIWSADHLAIRKVGAIENWIWPWDLIRSLNARGFKISFALGFNFLPFLWPRLFRLVTYLDRLERLFPIAINIAISARKAANVESTSNAIPLSTQ